MYFFSQFFFPGRFFFSLVCLALSKVATASFGRAGASEGKKLPSAEAWVAFRSFRVYLSSICRCIFVGFQSGWKRCQRGGWVRRYFPSILVVCFGNALFDSLQLGTLVRTRLFAPAVLLRVWVVPVFCCKFHIWLLFGAGRPFPGFGRHTVDGCACVFLLPCL